MGALYLDHSTYHSTNQQLTGFVTHQGGTSQRSALFCSWDDLARFVERPWEFTPRKNRNISNWGEESVLLE